MAQKVPNKTLMDSGISNWTADRLPDLKGKLYVIEVNPRASRTVPFVSISIGVPLAKLAAKIMVGMTLKELGFTEEILPPHYCVKEAVFPWSKFPGIDIVLGPEMKSTGEVMGIDDDLVEGQALAFMNGNGPGQFKGMLLVSAYYFILYLFGVRVKFVRTVFPEGRVNVDRFLVGAFYRDVFAKNIGNHPDFTIVIHPVGVAVVFIKHDLRALFQDNLLFVGVHRCRKISFDNGLKSVFAPCQLLQLFRINLVGRIVMRGKRNVAFVVGWTKVGLIPLVEGLQASRINIVVTYFIE